MHNIFDVRFCIADMNSTDDIKQFHPPGNLPVRDTPELLYQNVYMYFTAG